MVELRDVRMQFQDKKVLDGFSLKVEPQERLVIMGQSGSGKSTILRLILGTLRPNSGSIFFKQFEITRLQRRKLQRVRQHVGMVYQYSALLSSRNVRDNVALPLEELTDKSRDEIDKANLIGVMKLAGGVLSPWEAHEILRGVKTLGVRMDRHCQNARALAAQLQDDSRIGRETSGRVS